MNDYVVLLNEIRDAVIECLENATIRNSRGHLVKIYKRAVPEELGPNSVPLISVYKHEASGAAIEADQPDIRLPSRLMVGLGIADYSPLDLDTAEELTDDLINKVIGTLSDNLTLNDNVYGITVSRIIWDEERVEGVWFSLPTIELELVSTTIV